MNPISVLLSLPDAAIHTAPWLAAAFGIAASVAAERAFSAGRAATPPDRWQGEDSNYIDFDESAEIDERTERETWGERASMLQAVATSLGAGAAVEAAAASQVGWTAFAILVIGIVIVLVLTARRWKTFRDQVAVTKAWYARLKWSIRRKYVHHSDPDEEAAAFAHDFPREAAALRRAKL